MLRGVPHSAVTCSKTHTTRCPARRSPTSVARLSPLWLSTNVSSRSRYPPTKWSALKFMLQLSLACPVGGRASRTRVLLRRYGCRRRLSRSFVASRPVHNRLVHGPPFAAQKHPESWMSELHPAGGQVSKSSSTLGHPMRHQYFREQSRLRQGPQSFFRARLAASSCRGSGQPVVVWTSGCRP